MNKQGKRFTPHHVKLRSSSASLHKAGRAERGCKGVSKQPPQRNPSALGRGAGFTYTVSREQIDEYIRWPLDRRLKWLFYANKMRRLLPKKTIEIQEAFRQGKI